MASGVVDMGNFDPYSKSPGFKIDNGYVVNITCSKGHYWKNPANNVQYNIPDQMLEQPLSLPYSVTDAFVLLESTSTSLKESMSETVGTFYFWGMFSDSATVENSYSRFSEQSRLVGVVNSTQNAFEMGFPTIPMMSLASVPQNYLNGIC